MAELFEITELVKIAVEDEATGVAFYSAVAAKIAKADLKELFDRLAEEEKFHKRRFEEMLADLGGETPKREEYPGQYMAYLRTLTDERAFPDEDTALRMARECADDAAAVELASRFERDTLILMNEMRGLVPEKDSAVVDELANEERGHLVTLAEARRQL